MIVTEGVLLDLVSDSGAHAGNVLATVSFGASRGAVDEESTLIALPMPVLGDGPRAEVWRTDAAVERAARRGFALARGAGVLFGASITEESRGLRQRAAEIYQSAIAIAREEGYPRIVRMWNHFPEIHSPESGLERYQAFCAGRAEGFEQSGLALGSDLPAASGVGTDGVGLVVMFLATRGSVRNVENPRQVSAFRYPGKYGPRSPSFARASVAEIAGEQQLFVSGTASILGCESVHEGNIVLQLDETLENLRAVCEVASEGRHATLDSLPGAVYRVYVRHPEHYGTLRPLFDRMAGPGARSLWIRGDVCRSELLLEIELWTRL